MDKILTEDVEPTADLTDREDIIDILVANRNEQASENLPKFNIVIFKDYHTYALFYYYFWLWL